MESEQKPTKEQENCLDKKPEHKAITSSEKKFKTTKGKTNIVDVTGKKVEPKAYIIGL
jgi:hypothetical protein